MATKTTDKRKVKRAELGSELPVRVRRPAYTAIVKISSEFRGASRADAIDALVAGWAYLTPEQQSACFRLKP